MKLHILAIDEDGSGHHLCGAAGDLNATSNMREITCNRCAKMWLAEWRKKREKAVRK
jgi:hypothetical protein